MAQLVTPAFLDDLIDRCADALAAAGPTEGPAAESILHDLRAVSDHLALQEHHALGEWIRDLRPDSLSEFLADMEISARQAGADSDIGSFISTLADWQTTAEAERHGW